MLSADDLIKQLGLDGSDEGTSAYAPAPEEQTYAPSEKRWAQNELLNEIAKAMDSKYNFAVVDDTPEGGLLFVPFQGEHYSNWYTVEVCPAEHLDALDPDVLNLQNVIFSVRRMIEVGGDADPAVILPVSAAADALAFLNDGCDDMETSLTGKYVMKMLKETSPDILASDIAYEYSEVVPWFTRDVAFSLAIKFIQFVKDGNEAMDKYVEAAKTWVVSPERSKCFYDHFQSVIEDHEALTDVDFSITDIGNLVGHSTVTVSDCMPEGLTTSLTLREDGKEYSLVLASQLKPFQLPNDVIDVQRNRLQAALRDYAGPTYHVSLQSYEEDGEEETILGVVHHSLPIASRPLQEIAFDAVCNWNAMFSRLVFLFENYEDIVRDED